MEKQDTLLIGSGRLASHLANYFSLREIPFDHWKRSQGLDTLNNKIIASRRILLAISDSSLSKFFNDHLKGHQKLVIHFSAATNVPGTLTCHPLMSFGNEMYDLQTYEAIPFIVLSESLNFKELFPELKNPSHTLFTFERDYYHALCVMMGNYSNLLWSTCLAEFNKLGISSQMIFPYLTQSLENFVKAPNDSLTGPLSRGDIDTVQRNLSSINDTEIKNVYQSFVKLFESQQEKL